MNSNQIHPIRLVWVGHCWVYSIENSALITMSGKSNEIIQFIFTDVLKDVIGFCHGMNPSKGFFGQRSSPVTVVTA